jgi:hypothetical protein
VGFETSCALLSYFYGFTIDYISTLTIYQFTVYMQEIGNIMRIFNGQPPMKRAAEISQQAQALGMRGPNA